MFAIAPTDINWFYFLRSNKYYNDINFWTPTPWNISGLKPGEKLYFMLKSPIRKIGGFGLFKEYSNQSVEDVWNNFGYRNGCTSKEDLIRRLNDYKLKNSQDKTDVKETKIGCIILSHAELWEESSWIDLEKTDIDFSKNIVKLKYYDLGDFHTDARAGQENGYVLVNMDAEKLKTSRLITDRKGQSNFKLHVAKAYQNKCCITAESVPELLEAAHIQPYMNEHSNHVQNGLLLRSDLHRLYDNNLLYIDENSIIHVSSKIQSNYYRQFDKVKINLPVDISKHPSKKALKSRSNEFRK